MGKNEFQEQLEKYQMMVKKLSDDIFQGNRESLAYVLQQISLHYGLAEISIVEPLYAGWVYLQKYGFTTQDEVGEVMWKANPQIGKKIFVRMSSFIIMEWMKQNVHKS